jgi:hypothetical protein
MRRDIVGEKAGQKPEQHAHDANKSGNDTTELAEELFGSPSRGGGMDKQSDTAVNQREQKELRRRRKIEKSLDHGVPSPQLDV